MKNANPGIIARSSKYKLMDEKDVERLAGRKPTELTLEDFLQQMQQMKKMGGLQAMKEYNEKKAKILYDFLDESKLFKGTVRKEDRSLMNVPFVTGNDELDAKFVKEAKAEGLESLKGHRSVGGMRASIYNAMPIEGVEKLVAFMKKFEEENL